MRYCRQNKRYDYPASDTRNESIRKLRRQEVEMLSAKQARWHSDATVVKASTNRQCHCNAIGQRLCTLSVGLPKKDYEGERKRGKYKRHSVFRTPRAFQLSSFASPCTSQLYTSLVGTSTASSVHRCHHGRCGDHRSARARARSSTGVPGGVHSHRS